MERMCKFFIKIMILVYKRYISIFLGKNCRFYPTCSEYALAVLENYGLFVGIYKILVRIIKCNPFHPGGVDLP